MFLIFLYSRVLGIFVKQFIVLFKRFFFRYSHTRISVIIIYKRIAYYSFKVRVLQDIFVYIYTCLFFLYI